MPRPRLFLIPLLLALASPVQAQTCPQVQTTATGGGRYVVRVNGDSVSNHTAEREAIARAGTEKLRRPAATVTYTQALAVRVDACAGVAVTPLAPPAVVARIRQFALDSVRLLVGWQYPAGAVPESVFVTLFSDSTDRINRRRAYTSAWRDDSLTRRTPPPGERRELWGCVTLWRTGAEPAPQVCSAVEVARPISSTALRYRARVLIRRSVVGWRA